MLQNNGDELFFDLVTIFSDPLVSVDKVPSPEITLIWSNILSVIKMTYLSLCEIAFFVCLDLKYWFFNL